MKNIKRYIVILMVLVMLSVLGQEVSAHSLHPWSQYYTKEKIDMNYQFSISHAYHIDGRDMKYCWENNTARNYFANAVVGAVKKWDGMITATETSQAEALVTIKYNPNSAAGNGAAAWAWGKSGDSQNHFRKGGNDAEITFFGDTAYSSADGKTGMMAHEMGHHWGIADLYDIKPDIQYESIYDHYYDEKFDKTRVSRHDKNAMYIGQNRPWFQNWDGKWYYQEAPGRWTQNKWITVDGERYYLKSDATRATGREYIDGQWHNFDSNGKYLNTENANFGSGRLGYRPNNQADLNLDSVSSFSIPQDYKNRDGNPWFDIYFAVGGDAVNASSIRSSNSNVAQFRNYDNNIARFNVRGAGTAELSFTNKAGTQTYRKTVVVTSSQVATLSLSRTSWTPSSSAQNTTATVTTNQSSWSASSNVSWMSASRSGSTLAMSVSTNTSTSSRSGTITVWAGNQSRTISVTQSGQANVTTFSSGRLGYRPNNQADLNLDGVSSFSIPQDYKNRDGNPWFDIYFAVGGDTVNASSISSSNSNVVQFRNYDNNIARFNVRGAGTAELSFTNKAGTQTYRKTVVVTSSSTQNGLQKVGNVWYFFENGVRIEGWRTINGSRHYFFGANGAAKGWMMLSGYSVYFEENGRLVTGSKYIDGRWYTFDSNGYLIR